LLRIEKAIARSQTKEIHNKNFYESNSAKKSREMDKGDRMRACYQHACLCFVSNKQMTNESLRTRFGIDNQNYSVASRIIADTIKEGLVKQYDPENKSKKHAKYVPFWA
jgi:predicted HTH transcriptional regulator